jgi:polygalacturonase
MFRTNGNEKYPQNAPTKMNSFNVQTYGAVGDGVTNDGTAIASAITALLANSSGNTNGTLFFPQGTYLVSAPITVNIATPFTLTIK